MYYRLASTPWGSGLMSGLLFGAFVALLTGVGGASLLAAAVAAVVAGPAFGTLMGLMSSPQLSTLAGLAPADRATALRTVRKGEVTSDRRLAPAVAAYADSLRRRYHTPNTVVFKWLVGATAAFQVFAGVDDVLEGEWVWAGLRVPLLVAILLFPRTVRRAEERRERAERSARALLDEPS